MQILSVDVGTGTQDIYLFRSGVALENGFKLVMPSPTMQVAESVREATRKKTGSFDPHRRYDGGRPLSLGR